MDHQTRTQGHAGITWIDVTNPTREEIERVTEGLGFHPLHLDNSILGGRLPHIEREDQYLFLLLQLPVCHPKTDVITTEQIAFFLGKNYLITVHHSSFPKLSSLFNECVHDHDRQRQFFNRTAGFLLFSVLDSVLTGTSDIVQAVLGQLDQFESTIGAERESNVMRISRLRRKIAQLKLTVDPLHDLMVELTDGVHDYTGEDFSHHYRNLTRETQRLRLTLHEARETVEIIKDAEFTSNTVRTNNILAVLTIIFTFSIPATVVGTLYGMNIPMPGNIIAGNWTFLGKYTVFIFAMILSFGPVVGMWWYFKRKKWM